MREIFDACRKYGSVEKVNSYLNRVLDANKSVFEEVLAMGGAAVQEIISSYIKIHENDILPVYIKTQGIEARIRNEVQEEKARDTALELFKRGFDLNDVADIVKMPFDWVKNQVKTPEDTLKHI